MVWFGLAGSARFGFCLVWFGWFRMVWFGLAGSARFGLCLVWFGWCVYEWGWCVIC